MKTATSFIITLALFLTLAPLGASAKESGDEIIKKAAMVSYYSGDDGRARMAMLVYSKGSKKPMKKVFTMLKIDLEDGGRQKMFVHFSKPADINKTTFLVHKYIDKDDYRRLYLPASDKVILIAGSRKQDPFMGSDFSYEDISGRHYTKDNHQLVGEEVLDVKEKKGTTRYETFVVESTPKEKEDKIAKIKSWIDKKTYHPIRVEYRNHQGEVYKSYEASKIQNIDGFPTVMKRTMTSPLDETHTTILVDPKQTSYNIGIPENVFSDRSLSNPPHKYLK